MKTIIGRVQETYKRFTTSQEHDCNGLEMKTVYFGRPVSQEEIDERRERITSFDFTR